jgi:hypothetical protein
VDPALFEQAFARWQKDVPDIDKPLRAWGQQKPDLSDPSWFTKIPPSPLKEDPALKQRFDAVTQEMAKVYLEGVPDQCRRIRELIREHKGFWNFLGIPTDQIRSRKDGNVFLLALTYESMSDLGLDTRDAIVSVDELLKAARKAGIDPIPHLRQVMAVSNDVNWHRMGTMKGLLTSRLKALGGQP